MAISGGGAADAPVPSLQVPRLAVRCSAPRCGGPGQVDEAELGQEAASGEAGGERKAEMLSREELKACFEGVPNFPSQSVDEFVYLFPLNSDGQIEPDSFEAVVKELGVLTHAA